MNDIQLLRELVKRYRDCCERPGQDELRGLWRRHNALKPTRPLVTVMGGGNRAWSQMPGAQSQCEDPDVLAVETDVRRRLWVASLKDDSIFDPWITVAAERVIPAEGPWGVKAGVLNSDSPGGGANVFHDVPIKSRADMSKLVAPRHVIDEEKTRIRVARITEAVGDILPVAVNRCTVFTQWRGDISTDLAQFIGMEQLMTLMYEDPAWLHELLAFMRDGILRAQDTAEAAGDFGAFNGSNQSMTYAEDLPDPSLRHPVMRSQLWGYFAAQEYTLISPEMHEEFLLNYQMPVMRPYGLVAYGCCEDLTRKIDMLRKIPNLRRVAVTPVADVGRCAEQIGRDYVFSWRPNPAEVCCGFDEARIRKVIADGLEKSRGCYVDITLKDIDTVQGQPDRIPRWVGLVRREIDAFMDKQ